jgi:hypothetical protein
MYSLRLALLCAFVLAGDTIAQNRNNFGHSPTAEKLANGRALSSLTEMDFRAAAVRPRKVSRSMRESARDVTVMGVRDMLP